MPVVFRILPREVQPGSPIMNAARPRRIVSAGALEVCKRRNSIFKGSGAMKFSVRKSLAGAEFMVDVFEVRFVVIGCRSFLGREAFQAALAIGMPLREISGAAAVPHIMRSEVALCSNVASNGVSSGARVASIEEEFDEPAGGGERLLDRLEHRDRNNLAGTLEDRTHEREARARASVDQQSTEDDEVLAELREVRAIGFYRRGTSVP